MNGVRSKRSLRQKVWGMSRMSRRGVCVMIILKVYSYGITKLKKASASHYSGAAAGAGGESNVFRSLSYSYGP